jgi:hypothetical protein
VHEVTKTFRSAVGNAAGISLLLLSRRTSLRQSLSHLSVAPFRAHKSFPTVPRSERRTKDNCCIGRSDPVIKETRCSFDQPLRR